MRPRPTAVASSKNRSNLCLDFVELKVAKNVEKARFTCEEAPLAQGAVFPARDFFSHRVNAMTGHRHRTNTWDRLVLVAQMLMAALLTSRSF